MNWCETVCSPTTVFTQLCFREPLVKVVVLDCVSKHPTLTIQSFHHSIDRIIFKTSMFPHDTTFFVLSSVRLIPRFSFVSEVSRSFFLFTLSITTKRLENFCWAIASLRRSINHSHRIEFLSICIRSYVTVILLIKVVYSFRNKGSFYLMVIVSRPKTSMVLPISFVQSFVCNLFYEEYINILPNSVYVTFNVLSQQCYLQALYLYQWIASRVKVFHRFFWALKTRFITKKLQPQIL